MFKKFFREFNTFVSKGNVIDLAVGVIIGGAFGKIVNSIINDIIMPPLGYLIGGVDFKNLTFTLAKEVKEGKDVIKEAVVIRYGSFIQNIVEFFIIAFVIFLMVKFFNSLKRKEEAAPATPAPPTKDQELLSEIRDLLKNKNS